MVQHDVTGKVTEYTCNALDLIEKVMDNGIMTAEYTYYPDGSINSLKNGRCTEPPAITMTR